MSLTDAIVLAILTVIAASDAVLVVLRLPTYSRRLRFYGRSLASPCYCWGALAGHFWGPDGLEPLGGWVVSIGLLAASAVAVSIVHRRWIALNPWFPRWGVLAYVLIGIAPGALLWPQ